MIMQHMGNGILCKYHLHQKVIMGVRRSQSVLMDPGRIKWQVQCLQWCEKIHSVKTDPRHSYTASIHPNSIARQHHGEYFWGDFLNYIRGQHQYKKVAQKYSCMQRHIHEKHEYLKPKICVYIHTFIHSYIHTFIHIYIYVHNTRLYIYI